MSHMDAPPQLQSAISMDEVPNKAHALVSAQDKVEPRGDRAWHSVDSNFVDTAGPTGEYPEDTQTWIVQEFCNGGNLSEHLLSRADVSEAQLPDGHNMVSRG